MIFCLTTKKRPIRTRENEPLNIPPVFNPLLNLSSDQVELTNDMKDGNKSNEADAHNKNHIWRDLQSWGIISVELQHRSSCSS
ncbi:hypothetical protein EUGRSUZ_D02500 [Eucalyptus grandis]|uniref:Uncharacterized protein n=1 Tax=Eucalyptus grandis TaxID=71139 RepID=A0A059CJG4_EUCGR|nr:hypothetical protein EUGRSUZ_D02500 [Eucalyptus grandis]